MVEQKFGVTFTESLFWSEAFKHLPLLSSLQPLLEEKNVKETDALIKEIENYFKNNSDEFLQKNLD
ncbi:MAG TPA: hypothetical protein VE090_05365 [Methylomirabilota bacterium]|nr:hypothetical protein [Methylomirabilota bacterium]